MLQEGIAHSFEMLTEAKGRNLEVKRWLKTDTLPPALEVVAPNQEMKDACSKPVKSRTLDDVLLIVRWMKEVPTFHEFAPFMDEQELIVYCLCLMLRRLAKFEALCRIGLSKCSMFSKAKSE